LVWCLEIPEVPDGAIGHRVVLVVRNIRMENIEVVVAVMKEMMLGKMDGGVLTMGITRNLKISHRGNNKKICILNVEDVKIMATGVEVAAIT